MWCLHWPVHRRERRNNRGEKKNFINILALEKGVVAEDVLEQPVLLFCFRPIMLFTKISTLFQRGLRAHSRIRIYLFRLKNDCVKITAEVVP